MTDCKYINASEAERPTHIAPWVLDQMELVERLTDLYMKNKDTEQGLIKGMLGEQASTALRKAINLELIKLLEEI